MKKIIQSVLLFVVILCPTIVWSGNITKGSLEKLMASSGINKQVSELSGMVLVGAEESRQKNSSAMSDAVYNDLKKAIEKAFRPSETLHTISMEIKRNLSETEAQRLLDWYKSDIGRKITKAEEDASTPAAYQEMTKNAEALISDHERVALAERIESVVHTTDMLTQMNESTAIAVFTAFSAIINPDQREDMKTFKTQLSEQLKESRLHVREFVIASSVYTYKDIDMATMEKYIKFLERATTKKFNDVAIKGIEKALKQSTDKMLKSLTVDLKKNIKKPQTDM